jgi:hypothetical protein
MSYSIISTRQWERNRRRTRLAWFRPTTLTSFMDARSGEHHSGTLRCRREGIHSVSSQQIQHPQAYVENCSRDEVAKPVKTDVTAIDGVTVLMFDID